MLTGAEETVGIQAMREGAQDYIPKDQLRAPLLARSLRYAMERHSSSLALRESSESLSRVISCAEVAIITKDHLGTITTWNPAAEKLFGYSVDEALGKPLLMLVPPDRVEEEREITARIAKGERVEHFESIHIRKYGRPVLVALTISPIRDKEGRITGASKIARDITFQKQAEESLRNSERQQHRQLIHEAPISVAMFDLEMRYLAASRRWVEAYSNGNRHLVDCAITTLPRTCPSDGKRFTAEASPVRICETSVIAGPGRMALNIGFAGPLVPGTAPRATSAVW